MSYYNESELVSLIRKNQQTLGMAIDRINTLNERIKLLEETMQLHKKLNETNLQIRDVRSRVPEYKAQVDAEGVDRAIKELGASAERMIQDYG